MADYNTKCFHYKQSKRKFSNGPTKTHPFFDFIPQKIIPSHRVLLLQYSRSIVSRLMNSYTLEEKVLYRTLKGSISTIWNP